MRRRFLRGVKERYRGKHVRVFALDRDSVVARLRTAAARLLAEHDVVVEVRLFGSLARGDAAPGSDADLLVVVRGTTGRFADRADFTRRCFEDVGVACDVLVYTEAELAHLAPSPSLVRTALREGVVLARR